MLYYLHEDEERLFVMWLIQTAEQASNQIACDTTEAEELRSILMLRLAEHLHELRRYSNAPAWVWLVARHTHMDLHRARREVPTDPRVLQVLNGPGAPPIPTWATMDPDTEWHSMVHHAVGLLPPRKQEAVMRHYWSGQTYQEAAGCMGIAEERFGRLLRRAKARLRSMLPDPEDE